MTEKSIAESTFAAIDFESAGSAPGEADLPVQIGIARMGPNLEILPHSFFRSYISPGRDVSWAASKVHGITNRDLQDAPPFLRLWPDIRDRLGGATVVSHAAATEKRFLRAFPLHRFDTWVDSLRVARAAFPSAPDHSLGGLISHLRLSRDVADLCPDLRWHDALYDAVASLVLLRHIVLATGTSAAPAGLLARPDLAAYYRSKSQP